MTWDEAQHPRGLGGRFARALADEARTLYALDGGTEAAVYALASLAHEHCPVGEFCRNPLHPGPCKGWKHTLHAVSPGTYHALEKARVEKANARRLAKIDALKQAGKPVPKSLLRPVTYAPPGTPQPGYTPPTRAQARAVLPPTATQITQRLANKASRVAPPPGPVPAQGTVKDQTAAIVAIAGALGFPQLTPDQEQELLTKMDNFRKTMQPGMKFSDTVQLKALVDRFADRAMTLSPALGPGDKARVRQEIQDHIESGAPGLPPVVRDIQDRLRTPAPGAPKPTASKPAASGPTPTAPLPATASPQAKHAVAVASRSAPLAGTAKTQMEAYGKLERADFDGLPPAARDQIIKDLDNAHAEFLDPKKKAEVERIRAKLLGSAPAPTAAPLAAKDEAAAPAESAAAPPLNREQKVRADALTATLDEALTMFGVQPSSPDAAEKLAARAAKVISEQPEGAKLSDSPAVKKAIDKITQLAHARWVEAGNKPSAQKAGALRESLTKHLDAGKPGVPLMLKNIAKAHGAAQQSKATTAGTPAVEVKAQTDAIVRMAGMLGFPKPSAAQLAQLHAKLAKQRGGLKPGQKLSDSPPVRALIDKLAGSVMMRSAHLGPGDKESVRKEIAAHIDAGLPGVPAAVTTAHQAHPSDGKVSGPLAHPDMMAVVDHLKSPASPAQLAKVLDNPGVNETELAKLPKATREKVAAAVESAATQDPTLAAKAAKRLGLPAPKASAPAATKTLLADLALDSDTTPSAGEVSNATRKLHAIMGMVGSLATSPGEAKKRFQSLPPEQQAAVVQALHSLPPAFTLTRKAYLDRLGLADTPALSPNAAAAAKLANGGGTSKMHLSVYQKLTPQEFQSLPVDTRKKVISHLSIAAGKFLDPQKKWAAQSVIARLTGPATHGPLGQMLNNVPASPGPKPKVNNYQAKAASTANLYRGLGLSVPGFATESKWKQAEEDGKPDFYVAGVGFHAAKEWIHKAIPEATHHQENLIVGKLEKEIKDLVGRGEPAPREGSLLAKAMSGDLAGVVDAVPGAAGTKLPAIYRPDGPGAIIETSKTIEAVQPSPPTASFKILPKAKRGSSGDGWYTTAEGKRTPYWGKYGASGVMIRHVDADGTERFLMVKRGAAYDQAGRWQLPGGALEQHEDAYQAAAREVAEEIGASPAYMAKLIPDGEHVYVSPDGGWKYTSLAATAEKQFSPKVDGTETADAKWLTRAEIDKLDAEGKLITPLSGGNVHKNLTSLFPPPIAPPRAVGLGAGKSIASIPAGVKLTIANRYSELSAMAEATHDPEAAFVRVLAVARGQSLKLPQPLSALQVVRVVDEDRSKKIPDWQPLEGQIGAWLATPAGAARAKTLVGRTAGPGKYRPDDKNFPGISHQAAVATRQGRPLSPPQRVGVKEYTGSSWHINDVLRKGEAAKAELGADAYSKAQHQAADLQSAMNPLPGPVLLHRGTGWEQFPVGYRNADGARKLIGKVISDPAFLSTTISDEPYQLSSKSVRLAIEAPAGTMALYVSDMSEFPGEREMLLAAGTKMRVISVDSNGSQTIVRVRVVS